MTKDKRKRQHGIRKQCKRCYGHYNPKTQQAQCPHVDKVGYGENVGYFRFY